MKLPFVYPEHPEFKAHVEYVAGELLRFSANQYSMPMTSDERKKLAEERAKDIVLWVSSRPVPWWERVIDKLRGKEPQPVDDMFEQGVERWLRETIERVLNEDVKMGTHASKDMRAGFELGWTMAIDRILSGLKLDDSREGKGGK